MPGREQRSQRLVEKSALHVERYSLSYLRDYLPPIDQRLALLPQLLRGNAQRAIELTRCVFPGDGGRQLHQGVFIEKPAQSLKEFVIDVASRNCHSVGEFKRKSFLLSVEVTVCVIRDGLNLVVGNSELAAHGSINVLSKLATVEEGNAPIDQCSQTWV